MVCAMSTALGQGIYTGLHICCAVSLQGAYDAASVMEMKEMVVMEKKEGWGRLVGSGINAQCPSKQYQLYQSIKRYVSSVSNVVRNTTSNADTASPRHQGCPNQSNTSWSRVRSIKWLVFEPL